MLEQNLDNMITSVEQQLTLVKIKLKTTKKELKQIDKTIRDNKYIDIEIVKRDKTRLNQELSELDIRIYKLNKILYRLRVCRNILNNEDI